MDRKIGPHSAQLGNRSEPRGDRCRDKIFGDIFLLVFGSSAARSLVDFKADDAEQAFLSGG
jgi:hypothetical protein